MAKGLLGKAMSVNGNFVQGHIVDANADSAVITVDLENTSTTPGADAICEIYFSATGTPGPLDRMARAVVPAEGGHLELSCKLASPGEHIILKANSDDVAFRVTGVENIPTV